MKCEILTPVLTIFNDDNSIDYEGNKKLIEFLISNGVDGLVPLGSTGEFPAMKFEEKLEFLDFYLKAVDKRVKVLAGTGCGSYEETLELSRFALENGADGVLVIPPYYFGMSQEEGFRFYDRLAEDLDGDLYIYNFEARTGFDISCDTVVRLVEKHSNIKGMKDTTTSIEHTKECLEKVLKVRPDFRMYSGFDNHLIQNAIAGGSGNISAISNIFPDIWSQWITAVNEKDYEKAVEINKDIDDLMKIYSFKSNFGILFKYLLRERGLDINTTSLFPFDTIEKEDLDFSVELVKKYL